MANLFKISTLKFHAVLIMWYFVSVHSEQILAIEPKGGKSQWNFMKGILHALTDHGHNVTVFTPFPEGHRKNYTEIDLSKEIIPLVGLDIDFVQTKLPECSDLIRSVHNFSQNTCKIIYNNSVIQSIMNDSKPNFDIIIIELQASECISYLSVKLNIPLIYVAPPPIVSYVNVPRTFFERLINAILLLYTSSIRHYKFWTLSIVDTKPMNMVEPIEPSIVFSNAHDISDVSRPLLPNVIQIGGIHLRPPKRIPNDILDFMVNSPHGVIFFTLGSVVAISSLPEKTKKIIIEVLGQVPQRVLIKYEEEMTYDLPKNVMTRKWFPQRDILMHPNVKLFISHGGISGVYEAVDAGVPVLGFPLLFDQKKNLENLADAGMAIIMSLKFLSKDAFNKSVLEIINNEKYMKNAQIVSSRFNDRPMSPAQTVDYWTRTLSPGVIQVGGIHLEPPKKIPDDILEFMDNSQHGVIFFTLGSIVPISSLPEGTIKIILEVLGQVPQRVLIKYEEEMTNDLPKNIMTRKWFPQRDILVHPKVKLFISHGRISGVYEAVDAGVPVLGFPVVFDQKRNLENLVNADMAIVMSLKSMSKEVFKKSVLELINNEN